MTRDDAKKRFDSFGKTFTLDQARQDVHILIDAIYDALEAEIRAKHEWVMDQKKQTEFYFDKSQESRAELQVKDKELRVIKKIAQDAYTLGVSQATEMDRFWETFGLLDESVSVDDAIAFFKAKDERITELEAIVKKMRNCHNCSAFQCLLNFERVNACKENKLYLWQLKTK